MGGAVEMESLMTEMMKQQALKLMHLSGAFDLMRWINRRHAVLLTYHRFSETGDSIALRAGAFAAHIEYLVEHYRLVPLSELVPRLASAGHASERLAAITIDDGYADAYQIAMPLLKKHGVPATLFVVTGFVDRGCWIWTDKMRYLLARTRVESFSIGEVSGGERFFPGDDGSRAAAAGAVNSWLKLLGDEARERELGRLADELGVDLPAEPPPGYEAITWDQAREMEAAGIEIGSHTVSHPILTNCDPRRVAVEVRESRRRLEEELGHQVDLFCYPNGNYSELVCREVERAGYGIAVTTDDGLISLGDDPLRLKRVHTQEDLVHFAQSASGFELLKDKIRMRGRKPDFFNPLITPNRPHTDPPDI